MSKQAKIQQEAPGATYPPEGLSREKMEVVCRTIIQYLETSKRYVSPEYCVWELARETGISARKISTSINQYMGRNYYEFINRIRTEEAKRILREAAAEGAKVNMADVITKSGFSSQTVFFRRFSEFEGMTPKKYMSLYRKKPIENEPSPFRKRKRKTTNEQTENQ